MAAKALRTVAVAVIFVIPSVLCQCSTQTGVSTYFLSDFCGEYFRVPRLTRVNANVSCMITQVRCTGPNKAEMNTYTFVNNKVDSVLRSNVTQIGQGVLRRIFDNGLAITEFVLSENMNFDGTYQMSFLMCQDGVEQPWRYGIVANYAKPNLATQEAFLKEHYGCVNMFCIPDTCNPKDYFEN